MKITTIILGLLISLSATAQNVYYVATTGDDSNLGTINSPWLSWEKALLEADAGDTVYFRGGTVYYPSEKVSASVADGSCNTGTQGNPIVFAGYPPDVANGDSIIFDFSNVMPIEPDYAAVEAGGGGEFNHGISISWMNYFEFRDFTVRNVWQVYRYVQTRGINFYACNYITLERLKVYNIGGQGIFSSNGTLASGYVIGESEWVPGDTTRVINCDAYRCIDSLAINPYQYNNNQAGSWAQAFFFGINFVDEYMEFIGCRAWECADDGFNNHGTGTTVHDQCWSFNNGIYLPYLDYTSPGGGFKLNNTYDTAQLNADPEVINHWVTNCIAAFNEGLAFNENHVAGQPSLNRNNYNNTAYRNDQGFVVTQPDFEGWVHRDNRYINNLAYANITADYGEYNTAYFETDLTNSWSNPPNVTVTDADFLDLPANAAENLSILAAPRQADGSLPDIGDYYKLAPTSNLIGVGTDVGMSETPNLGVDWEYVESGYTSIFEDGAIMVTQAASDPIIADHTVVDLYDDIPANWIDSVKTMWLSYAGESHSEAIRAGLTLLEASDATYSVSIRESGTPEAYRTDALRASRATWGNLSSSTGWIYNYGEEDWYTSATAITRTEAGITYIGTNGPVLDAFGFGWCWDPAETAIDMPSYIEATKGYIDLVATNGYETNVFFTTGPVDGEVATGEVGWNKHLAYEVIRDSVNNDPTRILFDFADILCYDDGSATPTTTSWNGNTYPIITSTNYTPTIASYHMSEAGAVRLAKATWWMLARIAGWDGVTTSTPVDPPDPPTPTEATIRHLGSGGKVYFINGKYLK